MIALDTNVLVRVLVGDDVRQSHEARALVDRALADQASLFVSTVVLCEVVWVLRAGYRKSRAVLTESLLSLLATEQLEFERRSEVERALNAYAQGSGDFSDYLIREVARQHGARAVATFDRVLWQDAGFVSPDPATWGGEVSLQERPPSYGRRKRRRARATNPQSVS